MLVLSSTTDKIQIVLESVVAVNQLQCVASWRDITATPTYTAGRSIVNTNGITDVDFIAAPGLSTQRVIDFMSFYNDDTVPAILTVKFDDNGTDSTLIVQRIGPGETLHYTDEKGFFFAGNLEVPVSITTDNATGDSFSRLRVSGIEGLFDAQFTYDLQPLLFEQTVAESGATVVHSATDRSATMSFAATPTGGVARLQSYSYHRYQPGKSHLVFITFNLRGGVVNVVKSAGYSDGVNGFEFLMDGLTPTVRILSDTVNGDQVVAQTNWNLDKLDGSGISGKTLDPTKTQILVIDFQALYVGRVRFGFDIDGVVYYFHQFLHANLVASPYIQTANLPIRVGMTSTGTVSTTMDFVCCSVISEGGQEFTAGYDFTTEGTVTAGNDTRTHLLSLRPRATFNDIVNRSKFVLEALDVLVVGSQAVLWELVVGQALTAPMFTNVNATYSAIEKDTVATLNGSPGIVIASGYVPSTAQNKGAVGRATSNRYPITLNAAGAVRDLGTVTLLVTGLGATSVCRATLCWKEIR